MCFSATASFTAAGVLLPMGGYCLWCCRGPRRRYWPFALIPVLFAIQQAAEGVVWRSLAAGEVTFQRVATGVYLFCALAWWPFWFPVAAAIVARAQQARCWLIPWAVLSLGWFIAAYLPGLARPEEGLAARVANHSVHYPHADQVVFGGAKRWPMTLLYCLFVGGPLLLLGRRVYLVPIIIGCLSIFVSLFFYQHAYSSMWCFFAALLSAYCVYFFATEPDQRCRHQDAAHRLSRE